MGDAAPDVAGATIGGLPFDSDAHVSLSNAGAFSYVADLAGVDPARNTALFAEDVLIARVGDQVSGLSGLEIARLLTRNAVADTGAVAFQAGLSEIGVTGAPFTSAIFAASSDGALNLIAREGDQLVRGDGRIDTVTSLIFRQHGFSDNGRFLAFEARFADSVALYRADLTASISAIPLPASAWLLLSALALGAGMRRLGRG